MNSTMLWCGCTVYIEWISCVKWSVSFRKAESCPSHNIPTVSLNSYWLLCDHCHPSLSTSVHFWLSNTVHKTHNLSLKRRNAAFSHHLEPTCRTTSHLSTFTPAHSRAHVLPLTPAGDNWRVKLMHGNPETGPSICSFPTYCSSGLSCWAESVWKKEQNRHSLHLHWATNTDPLLLPHGLAVLIIMTNIWGGKKPIMVRRQSTRQSQHVYLALI